MRKLLIFCILVIAGCSRPSSGDPVRRVDNIVRVMMHEPNYFTFIIQPPGSSQLHRITLRSYRETEVFIDVPEENKMWIEYTDFSDGLHNCGYLEIHIHSEKKIEGAGWDHGKAGRGTTVVVK